MRKIQLKRKYKNILKKAVPLWLTLILLLNSILATGFIEYYLMKKNFNSQLLALSQTTKNPQELVLILKQKVLPQKGYPLSVKWNDIGRKLMESGVIDKKKYEELFLQDQYAKEQMKYLGKNSSDHMMINEKNSRFMVNTLWALGLVNKNKILTEGSMKTYGEGDVMRFASTGGWNLGTKQTSELYASTEIIKLTSEQEEIVKKIAQNVYRPCCGNSTEFPDCNHGMAALGYIEAAVAQGVSEKQIYKDLLKLNAFWFPQQYVELAAYLNSQKTDWDKVDAKVALSSQYSSAQGAQQTQQNVQNIPGLNIQQGGCGA
ncbi:MAG: hypothetical protein HY424_01985 [Candidatus Levybacteria bacterium]|nr:hypothetical protein [Candidatus Levybacteria bacterium]